MKPKKCVCGINFTPTKPIQKYHSPACELSFKTGKVAPDNMINLPLQVLRDLATGTFQDYIKLRDRNKGCYTCERIKGVLFHAGHAFKKELFSGMIFNETSTRKQCDSCNIARDGNTDVFMQRLQKELGIVKFIDLENQAVSTKNYRWSKIEFIDIIEVYKNKIQARD